MCIRITNNNIDDDIFSSTTNIYIPSFYILSEIKT